jgi:hypothetical protein
VNIESGLEGAVALLDGADVLNLEALDPDQIAWASSANAAATRLAGRSLATELAIQQSAADLVDQGESGVAGEVSDRPARVRWWLT